MPRQFRLALRSTELARSNPSRALSNLVARLLACPTDFRQSIEPFAGNAQADWWRSLPAQSRHRPTVSTFSQNGFDHRVSAASVHRRASDGHHVLPPKHVE